MSSSPSSIAPNFSSLAPSPLLTGLPPVADAGIKVLILGSFPSPASLQAGMYYAHKQNHFWRILAALLSQPLPELPLAERYACLLQHGIGLWDIYGRCRRQGALDAAIRDGEFNDFAALLAQAPRLRRVCFNGQTAARIQKHFVGLGFEVSALPSSSPAYTLPFAEKLTRWRAGLGEAQA
jgi:hypoxanthine-DNA glycosylase